MTISGYEYPGLYVDLDGRPVKRTPWEYKYSYDEYVRYKSPDFRKDDHMEYSDRMWEWGPDKFRQIVAQVWPDKPHSQMFHDKKPEDIQKFLCLYFGRPVKLTAVLQGCNNANGNPYWVFAYRDVQEEA